MMAGPLKARRGGGWQGSRAMQVIFVLGLEYALSKSDTAGPAEGHEDWPSGRHDVHPVGSSDEPLMEQHRELFCKCGSQISWVQMRSLGPWV